MRLIFLDTETTGLSPALGARLLEIACVEMVDGKPTGRELNQLVNPGCPIPPGVSEIHGIRDDMVRDKPVFEAIAPQLVEFVGDSSLVIHHAPFDLSFLRAEFEGIREVFRPLVEPEQVIDTLPRFRKLHPGAPCSLGALCARYGVVLQRDEQWHRALGDARMLSRLWQISFPPDPGEYRADRK